MSISYSDCDVNALAYKTCSYAKKIYDNGIISISSNLNYAFNTTHPCAICGKTGHTFDDCGEMQDQAAIRQSYIQLRIALQKLKGIAASQGRDVNSLRSYKLSYINSINLNPPLSIPLDLVAANCPDKMEGVMVDVVKCLHSLGARPARKDEDKDNDHADNSLLSLNQTNLFDFLKGA